MTGLIKYSNKYHVSLINVFGEWTRLKNQNNNCVNFIDLFLARKINFEKDITGYFKSRAFYLFVGFFSFLSLHKLIKNKKPDVIIIHLLSFIPLTLNLFFSYETKFILRISGFPRLNFFRKFLWKLNSKKIEKIICPTEETKNYLIERKIFHENKLILIEDPIIEISKILKMRNQKIPQFIKNKKYILSIGRLSIQKNYELLLNFFNIESKKDPKLYLVIAGEGEERSNIMKFIKKNSLEERVILLGFKNNIHNLLKHCYCFILTSLWEDPGFVLIEAAINNANIISSNCKSGPKEILSNGKGGFLFDSNNLLSLINVFENFKKSSKENIYNKKYYSKKKALNYSKFRHFKKLNNFLIYN